MQRNLSVGLDFDNTIACYDGVFARAAVRRGLLPEGAAATKGEVRERLRGQGREDAWTELQGYVYGACMDLAAPFAGVREFLSWCRAAGVAASIISHRSREPYRGPAYDLHAAARAWLEAQGLLALAEEVHFEVTKEEKLRRIASTGCSHFVDDLPELLAEDVFPAGVRRILFDPHGRHAPGAGVERAGSWEAVRLLVAEGPR